MLSSKKFNGFTGSSFSKDYDFQQTDKKQIIQQEPILIIQNSQIKPASTNVFNK
jgi:hypothetical protein